MSRSTAQIWVVTRHRYGISAFVSQTSFRGKTRDGVAKCQLFLRLRFLKLFFFNFTNLLNYLNTTRLELPLLLVVCVRIYFVIKFCSLFIYSSKNDQGKAKVCNHDNKALINASHKSLPQIRVESLSNNLAPNCIEQDA